MYTQRIIHIPAVGKGPELRAALEARNAAADPAVPHSLSTHMFSPSPAFVHSLRFENLAAIEAYEARRGQNPAFQAQGQRINDCLAQERISTLYRELSGTPMRGKAGFLIRNRYSPAPGKGPELQAVLAERIEKAANPGVAGARLSQQVGSLDGPAFAVTLLFGSMADMDTFFDANQTDPTFRPFLAKAASLCRAPVQQRIQRIIAPFPS